MAYCATSTPSVVPTYPIYKYYNNMNISRPYLHFHVGVYLVTLILFSILETF